MWDGSGGAYDMTSSTNVLSLTRASSIVEGKSRSWSVSAKLIKHLLIGSDPGDHSLSDGLLIERARNDLVPGNDMVTQFQHHEVVGISDDTNFRPWTVSLDESEIPIGIRLCHVALRPQSDNGDGHLIADQSAVVD
jgi:hypothetical protein